MLLRGHKPDLAPVAAPVQREAPAEDQPTDEQLDWIEIVFEDQQGRPVPDVRFELLFPDGSSRQYRANAQAVAYIDMLRPGTCELCPQRLDRVAWEPA